MEFDHFTVVLKTTPAVAPVMTDDELQANHDAHLAHLAELQDAGVLKAAGPVGDLEIPDRPYRGLSIMACDADEALRLCSQDPAVVAGRFELVILPWLTPAGTISFGEGTLPRSSADVEGD